MLIDKNQPRWQCEDDDKLLEHKTYQLKPPKTLYTSFEMALILPVIMISREILLNSNQSQS